MSTQRLVQLKARLDELVAQAPADEDDELPPEARGPFEAAVAAFVAAPPGILDDATAGLWAYYRAVASEFTPQQRQEYGILELDATSDIWEQVEFSFPPGFELGGGPLEPDPWYLVFEGEVSWEPEHGLQLVFTDGPRVRTVGPYDGHHTVAAALGDAALLGEIHPWTALDARFAKPLDGAAGQLET